MGVEEHFALRNHGERGDPGDQARLPNAMRRHATESVQVGSSEIHENRLGEVVEIEPQHEYLSTHGLRGIVEQSTSPDPTERTRNRARKVPGGVVGGDPERFSRVDDTMFDPQSSDEFLRSFNGRRAIARDPFVDGDRYDPDVRTSGEVFVDERERDRRVLSSRERHPDRPSLEAGDLAVHLATDPLPHRGTEVR